MSYCGSFEMDSTGLRFRVCIQVLNSKVWVAVPFTWETLSKMQDLERETQVIIARVVSRVVANLEGDE